MAEVTLLLSARGLTRAFGGVRAVDGVDIDLRAGEIHALIGPNGAGKSTLVGLLAGRIRPDAGQVVFDGRDVTRAPARRRVRMGLGYAFQITNIYPAMTVLENVCVAVQSASPRAPETEIETRARAALTEVGLTRAAAVDEAARAGDLAYGHQRLLEVAMGLSQRPRLLILDEPTQGLSDAEIVDFVALVRRLAQQTTILLIEHNMAVVMALADRITVLDRGRVLAVGAPDQIRADRAVQDAYLGAETS